MSKLITNLDKREIYTLIGVFKDNIFSSVNGDKYSCCSYKSCRLAIEDKIAVINMRWSGGNINSWTIFQYVLL